MPIAIVVLTTVGKALSLIITTTLPGTASIVVMIALML